MFPLGSSLTAEVLEASPYRILAELSRSEPVSWVPALDTWLITGRSEVIEAMRDPARFTVDDPRFTTAAVLGTSMLNLDGPEHQRHRRAFADFFRPRAVRDRFEDWLETEAGRLLAGRGDQVELRTGLAGPLAVNTIVRFLGLKMVDANDVLTWYRHISEAIVQLTVGGEVSQDGKAAVEAIRQRVHDTLADGGHSSLIRTIHEQGELSTDELAPAVAVVMFGAIETSEGMTSNALWHLLSHRETLARVAADRSLVGPAIEESLRLEPAAALVDRYTTVDLKLGGIRLEAGSPVSLSLLAANRDAETFVDPDRFDIDRSNLRQHVTFVQGPHTCIGVHLARAQTVAAVNAVLDCGPKVSLDPAATQSPSGLIFRKPAAVTASWPTRS